MATSSKMLTLKATTSRGAAERLLAIFNDPASPERQALDGIVGPAELIEAGEGYILQAARVEVAHG